MITSPSNDKIKRIRALQSRSKTRREEGRFVVEGVRLAEEAVRAGWQAELALYTEDLNQRGMSLIERLRSHDVAVEAVAPEVMRAASDTETPQGILIVLPMEGKPAKEQVDLVLIVDQVRDPGNLGALLRSAAAVAVDRVLLLPGTVDVYSPKVVRAGMGAHFQVHLQLAEVDTVSALIQSHHLALCIAEADAATRYDQYDLNQPLALVVGGESEGPSRALRGLLHTALAIPLPGAVESLNAGVAGSVLLFEILRQRMNGEGQL
jgi:TrmH family RNA methyltransferase